MVIKGQPTVTTKKHTVSRKMGQEQLHHPRFKQHFLGRVGGSEFWVSWICALPKANMAPENRPSQTSIKTYSNHPFSRANCKIFQAGVVEPFLAHMSTCAGQTCDQRCRSSNSDGTWLLFPSAPRPRPFWLSVFWAGFLGSFYTSWKGIWSTGDCWQTEIRELQIYKKSS